jgi:hypothetical protein
MSEYFCRNTSFVAKNENGETKGILKTKTYEDDHFMSIFTKSSVVGPKPQLAKGPQDDLLL